MSAVGWISVIIGFFAVGCVPFPHMERRASEIHGTLVVLDAPPDTVRVKRVLSPYRILPGPADTTRPLCERSGEDTTVDATGSFHFDERRAFYPVLVLYGDPMAPVTICIDTGTGLKEAWHEGFLGPPPPKRLELLCRPETGSRAAECHGP